MDHRALSVLLLLVCAQWAQALFVPDGVTDSPIVLDDDLVPQELSFPVDEFSEVLYQGDMILSDDQWRSILQRKAMASESYRWPKSASGMVVIDYRYNDTIVSRPGVLKAMAAWEAATCVRFHEVPSAVAKPHLIFKTSNLSCSSVAGYRSSQNGQDVNLMPSCFDDDDTVIHELGHSLGLWHEQSRSDRDAFVTIMLENVIPGKEHNFNKEVTNNYGLPYDYSSVMHYHPLAFSKNNLYTIVTKDPLAQPLSLDSKGLSFMDKKIVNVMYNCTNTWLAACGKTTDPCKNLGYLRSNCTCECPAGTSGVNCETLNLPYTAAMINAKSPGSQRITTEGTVTSPGYPIPVTTNSVRVQSIEAPECHRVKLTFNVYDLYEKVSLSTNGGPAYLGCWFTILQIKLDDPPLTSNEYCGGNFTAPKTFESVGRSMVLTYSTRALASNTKTGYSATVKFVPVTTGNCTPTTPTTTSAVVCNTSPTTTAAPLPAKIINSGRLPLTPSSSIGNCSLVPTADPSIYFYRSPNYPSNYSKGGWCTIWFNTTEPRYLKVTPLTLSLGSLDIVDLYTTYQKTTVLNPSMVGTTIILPTSSSRLSFVANTTSPGGKFDIRVEVVNTGCHQLIELKDGSTGSLSIPANYPAGTICEWWLRAPVGRKVQVSFSRFFIGVTYCYRDSLTIDITGDTRYMIGPQRYCGDNMFSPGTVTSLKNPSNIGNALNILVNGQWGNYQGLNATYKVV